MKKLALMKRVPLLLMVLFAFACSKNNEENSPVGPYEKGVLVKNEGQYLSNNASLSFINSSQNLESNVFLKENNRGLGDILSGSCISGNKLYLIGNVSHSIEVVDRGSLKSIFSITEDLSNPRNAIIYQNMLIVSDWGDFFTGNPPARVLFFHKDTYEKIAEIETAAGPESFAISGSKLYVGNSFSNLISIIDLEKRIILKTISTGNLSPQEMYVDSNNTLWFMGTSYDENEPGAVCKYVSGEDQIERFITMSSGTKALAHLDASKDGKKLYYLTSEGVFEMNIGGTPSSTPIVEGSFYGFNVHPITKEIYTFNADFVNLEGNKVNVYSATGNLKYTLSTQGWGPNGCIF